jgi:hypothetical protein
LRNFLTFESCKLGSSSFWESLRWIILLGLQLSVLKVGGWIKHFCVWPFMEPLSTKHGSSMKGHRKLEAKQKYFVMGLSWSLQAQSSGVPWEVVCNFFCSAFVGTFKHKAQEFHEKPSSILFVQPPTFGAKN